MIKVNEHVLHYIEEWRTDKIVLNKERVLLINYLETHIFTRDDIYFDNEMIEDCIKFIEKWYFPLRDFQKFIIAFIFLYYKEDRALFYEEFLIMMARGAGKNGLFSGVLHFLVSPLHNIPNYNVSLVANKEQQAKISFEEIYRAIEGEPPLENMFYRTKMLIESLKTGAVIQYHTSNAKTKDGLRDGAVLYDEIHMYENFDVVNVFGSGLGKVKNPREFYVGTDGFVRDGLLDKFKERAMKILNGEELNDSLFPFICRIDDVSEVDNPAMWSKANPMFEGELNEYGRTLYRKVYRQYQNISTNPSSREEFVTKRMNLPEVDLQRSVASDEEMAATNRPIPDTSAMPGVFGLDFASLRDFAAVGALFKDYDTGNYVWKTHSFALKNYLDKAKLEPPIHEWEREGLLTILDEPSIGGQPIIDWFVDMREETGINIVVADNYKMEFLRPMFEEEGFEVVTIRGGRAVHGLLAPRIEDAFANHKIIFGDNPLMRWYTWNVYVNIDKSGLKSYLKKDEHRRKTDGFMALVHAMYKAADILDVEEMDFVLDDLI